MGRCAFHRLALSLCFLLAATVMSLCPHVAAASSKPGVTGFSDNNRPPLPGTTGKVTQTPAGGKADVAPDWWKANQNSVLAIRSVDVITLPGSTDKTLAIHFSQALPDDGNLQHYLSVYSATSGRELAGSWRLSDNAQIVYFPLPPDGHYVVYISAGLADRAGHTLNHSVYGPVKVQ